MADAEVQSASQGGGATGFALEPTAAELAAYGTLLRLDHLRFVERGAGRSGLLNAEQLAEQAVAGGIVFDAFERGAVFDRMAFNDRGELIAPEGR